MRKNPKAIGIWGYGREGQVAYDYLKNICPQAEFTILSDDKMKHSPEGAEYLYGDEAIDAIAEGTFDLIVKSPGISLYRPEIKQATKLGTEVTSTTNLWFERYPDAKVVGVTGTKGKSTTSRLIHYILEQQGVQSLIAGNVGIPLLDCVPGKDVTIIELSSYQIADLQHAPDYCVITNLYPEHTPWHDGSVEQYYTDKLRLATMNADTNVIANADNVDVLERLSDHSNVSWYQSNDVMVPEIYPLKGAHNVSNLAAAFSLVEALGYSTNIDLSGFEQLPHRLQELGTFDGCLCVNDSISTVPQATLAALDAYKGRSVTLIMGGQDRGQDYGELAQRLSDYDICSVMLLPDNGSIIAKSLFDVQIKKFDQLEDAVRAAFDDTPEGGVILLSPGAPSFGHFKSFEQRGECFAKACSI